jgi:hypothetical protein
MHGVREFWPHLATLRPEGDSCSNVTFRAPTLPKLWVKLWVGSGPIYQSLDFAANYKPAARTISTQGLRVRC